MRPALSPTLSPTLGLALALGAALTLSTPARADSAPHAAGRSLEALTEAAAGVVVDDRARVEDAAQRAEESAAAARALLVDVEDLLGRRKRRIRKRADKLVSRTQAALDVLADDESSRLDLVRAFQRAAREASRLRRALAGRVVAGPVITMRPSGSAPVRSRAGAFRLSVAPSGGPFGLIVETSIGATLPQELELAPDALTRSRASRLKMRVRAPVGAVRLDATTTNDTASLWVVVRGPRADLLGPLAPVPVFAVEYDDTTPSFRVGAAASLAAPDTGETTAETFEITPALPDGLLFDEANGALSGLPTTPLATTAFTVTATAGSRVQTTELSLDVAPALPPGITDLQDGFEAQAFLTNVSVPVKLAFTPDGRLLFSELGTGNIRIVSSTGELLPTPFATLPISTGGERGLLGLAVAPDFATSGHVFAYASTPAGDGKDERNRVVRLAANGDVGEALTVILDDLPIGAIHNGGGLAFGLDGHLYVSVGDATVEANAQTEGVPAGKVLRIAVDGSIPADNPIADDPEWCRGLRNPFDIAFHPRTGGLYISENGPTANDELNFGQKGKNFQWGPVPPDLPEFLIGLRIQDWTPVIVPTGLTFVGPELFGAAFEDDLFLCSYDHAEVRRVVLSGSLVTDLDEEVRFLGFDDPEAIANKPLDVAEGPDGWLYVSTFSGIWRVRRWSE